MKNNYQYRLPMIMVTSMLFLWGFAYGLPEVLYQHFQETLSMTRLSSTVLQVTYFGAYCLIALTAGLLTKKPRYPKDIITGLLLCATGVFLFYSPVQNADFLFFLLALFILTSRLMFLVTVANRYMTDPGKPESSVFRLNLAQRFNGMGESM